MINQRRIVVVTPAYNAEQTLEATIHELPEAIDEIFQSPVFQFPARTLDRSSEPIALAARQ